MRRVTNQPGNNRTLTEYFHPKSKEKGLAFQQCSLPPFSSFLQQSPMQPSRLTNQPPGPPHGGMLPLRSPEFCHGDRPAPQHRSPVCLGPIGSLGWLPSSPTRAHSTSRDRLGPLLPLPSPQGSLCSPRLAPISSTNCGDTTTPVSPHVKSCNPVSPKFTKDLNKLALSPHTGRGQMTASRDPRLCYSGSKNITAYKQESDMAQSNDVRTPVQTVQLRRPPMSPLMNTRTPGSEVCRGPPSETQHWAPAESQSSHWDNQPSLSQSPDRSCDSRLPIMHSPASTYQERQRMLRTPTREKFIPAMDSNCSSQKRCREFEDCDNHAKKLCPLGANSVKAESPTTTTPGNSFCTSPASQPSPVLGPFHKITNSPLRTELACVRSSRLEPSAIFEPTQSSHASLSPKTFIYRQPMGAKQAFINAGQTNASKLIELSSPSKLSFRKRREEDDKKDILCSSSSSSECPKKHPGSSTQLNVSSHSADHTHRSTSASTAKTLSRGHRTLESRKSDSSTPRSATNLATRNGRTVERNKTAHPRRTSLPSDLDELFTPDPIHYVFHKTEKPKTEEERVTSEKSFTSGAVTSCSSTVTGSSCRRSQHVKGTGSPHAAYINDSFSSPAYQPLTTLPTVTLQRVNLDHLRSLPPKDDELKRTPVRHNDLGPGISHTESTVSSTSYCVLPPLPERQVSREGRKEVHEEDPIDVELDLGLSFALDLDLTQDSNSSEEEELLSLQEMMERIAAKPPHTPDKGDFSEPSTPGRPSNHSKTLPLPPATKSSSYKNTLDQMLEEINTNKKAKELETQLLTECKEDLLRIAEYEEAEETREEGISTEHQEFLQRYSLMSNAIKEVPPGEVVFNLDKFGRIFDQDALQLRQLMVNPEGSVQKTLMWSSPAQLRLLLNVGLFQKTYERTPCPAQVTRFLFKMMSVHSDRMMSEWMLQALYDIACSAACQIVKDGGEQFEVWVPSLADVALVLMNMGVAFVTLFPFDDLQPPFTEGDLLEDVYIEGDSPSKHEQRSTFPEHNCDNVLKYLSYCMGLCPRAYSDRELLLLLTMVGRVGLDTRLILQSTVELSTLQYKAVNNFRDWDAMLPNICVGLTELTDDHHNMCLLVQLLPDNTRGKQLRRHLSLSMISKLLDGSCNYRPTETEIQLCELRPYLPRMQPSALIRGLQGRTSQQGKEVDMATLDQQAYYLCYSLLTLANEASNFQFFPARQKAQLMFLCSELETHVKCDIRESEKCLYRSKVKDLVARIYTKWQMLLQRTRPLNGKLYDYWQPLYPDTLPSSQEEQEINNNDDDVDDHDGENLSTEEDEEEGVEYVSEDSENEVEMTAEEEEEEEEKEGDDAKDEPNKSGEDGQREEMKTDGTMNDTKESEGATESAREEMNQETEPPVHEESEVIEVQNIRNIEVETEKLVDRNTSPQPGSSM